MNVNNGISLFVFLILVICSKETKGYIKRALVSHTCIRASQSSLPETDGGVVLWN